MSLKAVTETKPVDIEPVLPDGPGITLTPPVEYDGQQISFISTDFNRLTGGDLRQIAKEYKAIHRPDSSACYFLDSNYLLLVFARINKVEAAFFDKISGSSYLALTEFYKLGVQESLSGN